MKNKRRQIKLIALILALVIITSAVVVGLVPAFADNENGTLAAAAFPGADIVAWFIAIAWYWQLLIILAAGVVIGLIIRGLRRK